MHPILADKAALLVIDVQAGLFGAQPSPYEGRAVIDCINHSTAKARAAKVPVFFTQQDGSPEENLVPLTAGWRLHPEIVVDPGDRVIRKTTCDAFYETPLETELRSRGVETVIICGYATDFCIDATIRNALSKDFEVVVIGDGHTTSDSPVLDARRIREHHNWAWPNCTSKRPVQVMKAALVSFRTNGA